MEWLDILKSAEVLIGLIATSVALICGAIAWIDRKAKRRADGIKNEIQIDGQEDRSRLVRLEREVKDLDNRFISLDGRVEQGFRDADLKIGAIERSLETVARQDDVARIERSLSGLTATVSSVGRQVTMMFEATLRREKGGGNQ